MSQQKLRFCMFATFYPPYHFGGDGVYLYRLAGALAGRGHQVDVVHSRDAHRLVSTAANPAQWPSFQEQEGVRRIELDSPIPMLAALAAHQAGVPALYGRQIRAVLEQGEYDVLHYHNVSLLGAPGLLSMGDAVKLFTPHEYWLVCPTHVLFRDDREPCVEKACLSCTLTYRRPPQLWRQGRALQQAMSHVDLMLPPSVFALEQHRQAGFDVPMKVLAPPVSGHRETSRLPSGEVAGTAQLPYFLYVGRLEKLKGVQDLIEAFRGLDGAELRVVGAGNYESALRRAAEGLPGVKFLGARHPDELISLYRDAVALVAPSQCYETFGLTVAEAAMQGTPSIVRNHGALAELVEDGNTALPFVDVEGCRAAMGKLLDDSSLRDALGHAARVRAEQLWSEEAHIDTYLTEIDALLRRRVAEGSPC